MEVKGQNAISKAPLMWVMMFLGYEWLVSGINKAAGGFISGFHGEMADAIKNGAPFPFYSRFLKFFFLNHSESLAVFIEVGEIFAGAAFILIGIMGLLKKNFSSWLAKIGIFASIISAFLSINIFFYVGGHYFFGQADPFDEGITLDLLLFLIELATIGYFISLNRATKTQ